MAILEARKPILEAKKTVLEAKKPIWEANVVQIIFHVVFLEKSVEWRGPLAKLESSELDWNLEKFHTPRHP